MRAIPLPPTLPSPSLPPPDLSFSLQQGTSFVILLSCFQNSANPPYHFVCKWTTDEVFVCVCFLEKYQFHTEM